MPGRPVGIRSAQKVEHDLPQLVACQPWQVGAPRRCRRALDGSGSVHRVRLRRGPVQYDVHQCLSWQPISGPALWSAGRDVSGRSRSLHPWAGMNLCSAAVWRAPKSAPGWLPGFTILTPCDRIGRAHRAKAFWDFRVLGFQTPRPSKPGAEVPDGAAEAAPPECGQASFRLQAETLPCWPRWRSNSSLSPSRTSCRPER